MATSGGDDVTGFWGTDTEALRRLSGSIGSGGEQLDDLAARLSVLIDSVDWIGPDADTFRADWSGHPCTRRRPARWRRPARR